MLAIIEYQFETPIRRQRYGPIPGQERKIRSAIAIEDGLDIPLGRSCYVAAVALVRLREIDSRRVFRFVLIRRDVSLIVIALADEPGEDPRGIGPISHPALHPPPVPRGDVLFGDRPPKGALHLAYVHPSFYPLDHPFHTRPLPTKPKL